MTLSYDLVCIAPESEFVEEVMHKSFDEIMEGCCRNVVAEDLKSLNAQHQTDSRQSTLGGRKLDES